MLKHLNSLCIFNSNVVNEYWITVKWSGISVLKQIVEYALVKAIPNDLLNTFCDKDFKCFEIFKTSVYVFSD